MSETVTDSHACACVERRLRRLPLLAGTKIYVNACAAIGVVPNTRVKQLLGLGKHALDINRMFLGRGIQALAEAITYGTGQKSTPLKTLGPLQNPQHDLA